MWKTDNLIVKNRNFQCAYYIGIGLKFFHGQNDALSTEDF